jgi:hypothetical protein
MANRKKLGEILIEQGAATVDALKRGLSLQRQRGGRLGRTLVEIKAISESQLARALAAQSRMPLAKMKEEIPSSITDLVPLELCRNHQAIAFGARSANGAQTVYIAVADPYDTAAMDTIRAAVGSAVKFALAPASEIARAVARASAESDAAFSRHPGPPVSPEPPAPLPSFEDPPAFGFAPPKEDGGAVLDALLGMGPTSLPPPPPSPADAGLDDLFDGGMLGIEAPPPPPPALNFETDADVFDLSSQAEAVAAYTAEFARAVSPPQAPPLEPQRGFLLGEALLDTAPAPVSLDVGPGLGAAEELDVDVPEAVLPGIELTPDEMAQEAASGWPSEASPWPEEQGHAIDSPLGILPPAPVALDAPAFEGIPSTAENLFTEATQLIDPAALAHLRSGGDLSAALAEVGRSPPEPAPQIPASHAPEEEGFDLFMVEEAKAADAPKGAEALGAAPPPETTFDVPGMEDGWKEDGWEEGEAPRPLDLDAPAKPIDPAAGAPLESLNPPPVVLPDLESLRAELSAYSTEHGAAQVLQADIEAPDGGDLAAPAPVAAPEAEGAEPPAGAAEAAEPPVPRSTALPPPPDLKPVSVNLPLSPAPMAAETSAAPGSAGEPIEISSDEIIDIEPEAAEPAPKVASEPAAKLFDEASVETFGDALGSQPSGLEGSAPTGAGGSDEGERAAADAALPILPRSDEPSLVPSFEAAGAPKATADVLENLRRIAAADPLVDGMVDYSPDRLARGLAKLLSARGALSGGDLDGVLEAPPDKVSLHLVRALLAQALLAPDDLVAMLTTPPDRLNAAVWVRLIERGAVGPEELLVSL